MSEIKNDNKYNLEHRTFIFAKNIRKLVKDLPKTMTNFEDCKQLIRSSGSIGANYIEANESLSKKDFIMRVKICRKEAKETIYWLKLLDMGNQEKIVSVNKYLIQEAIELMKIFGAILQKSKIV